MGNNGIVPMGFSYVLSMAMARGEGFPKCWAMLYLSKVGHVFQNLDFLVAFILWVDLSIQL